MASGCYVGQQTLPSSQGFLLDGAGREQWFSRLSLQRNNLEGALESRLLGSLPLPISFRLRRSWAGVGGGRGLGICISIKSPGDADASGLGHPRFPTWRTLSLEHRFSVPGVREEGELFCAC